MAELQPCPICHEEYRNLKIHTNMAHKSEGGMVAVVPLTPVAGLSIPAFPSVTDVAPVKVEITNTDVMGMLGKILDNQTGINQRLLKLEQPGKVEWKFNPKAEDVAAARVGRDLDPRMAAIVDEILGEDFRFEVDPNKDRPGFLFTVIVPPRLSDVGIATRPVLGENGKYVMIPGTDQPVKEEYQPLDRRSRQISSVQSYDAIREHCERVRGYIVAYYQKMNRPLPEFKLKSNN